MGATIETGTRSGTSGGQVYHHVNGSGREWVQTGYESIPKLMRLCEGTLLPIDVKEFYFKCRISFRIRILNRKMASEKRKKVKKVSKIIN